MPRHLSPSGESFLRSVLADAEAAIKAINEWSPPPEHNHRCNEPPLGNCGPFLREVFGSAEGAALQAAINDDADRFAKSRSDRAAAQGLQFPNRAQPITKETVDYIRQKDAERQRRRRLRLREAREALNA